MTAKKALELKTFCKAWITKVVSTRIAYQDKLIEAVNDLFPDDIADYDPYDMLNCVDWDNGEDYKDSFGRTCSWAGMGDRLTELVEWDNPWSLTKKGQNDLSCTIRVAIDLLIKQSGGVVGYTIGDLRRVYDGNVPDHIIKSFKGWRKFKNAPDHSPVWL